MSAWPATAEDIRVVPLEEGEPAPFKGQLLTIDAAAKLGTKAELCSEKAKLERAHQHRMCMAKVDYIEQVNVIRSKADLDKIKVLEAALEASQKGQEIPFWDEPGFIWPVAITAGVVIGAVGLGAGAWAWSKLAVP